MFITFEGIDGAGKSTQIEGLIHRLAARGFDVVSTREPGGTPIGDALRAILLDPSQHDLSPRTEALLYATSRAQLLAQVVLPALDKEQVVICDRYVDASLAYQGAGLMLGVEEVARLNEFATAGLVPDLTFLFDIPVETSQERLTAGRKDVSLDRIERRSSEYFGRVRGEFLRIAKENPRRVVLIDATRAPQAIGEEIWSHISKRLGIGM